MAGGQRVFPAAEFLDRLRRDDLAVTPPLVGAVRAAGEGAGDDILFAEDCAEWTPIPVGMIDSVELLDSVTCGDSTYPLVAIHLKDPLSDEGRAYARLARLHTDRPKKLRQEPDGGVVVGGGGGGLSFGGGGSIRDTLGGGFQVYWAIWCPEENCFVEQEIWLNPSSTAYSKVTEHNQKLGHHAALYRVVFGG